MSRRPLQIHPARLVFWTVAVLAALAWFVDSRPFELDAGDPELAGRLPEVQDPGDTLVVLSTDAIAQSAARGEVAGAWSWVDMFQQEVGPVRVLDVEALDPEATVGARFVIFTRSACDWSRANELIAPITELLNRGTTVVLEMPAGELRSTWAADGGGGLRTPSSITALAGVDETAAQDLRRMPLLTSFIGNTRPLADAVTLVAFDGAPVIYARPVGTADVIIFEFDLGQQLMHMQQGLPRPDFSVRPRVAGRRVHAADLVADSSLMDSDVPWADLLERYVVHRVIGRRNAMFAFWAWPDGKNGGLLTSHQAHTIYGRPLWMSIHERGLEARSATFVAAPPEPVDPGTLDDNEQSGHAALLWFLDPSEAGLHRSWSAGPFTLLVQPMTLVSQLEQLEESLGERADVRGVRLAHGRWSDDWTGAYRAMDAVDLSYSVSYGPGPDTPSGFLFGTCQPFTPRDTNGLPFALREVPACFVDPSTPEESEALIEFIQNAAERHWGIHLLTSSDRFQRSPSMTGFDAWRDALVLARELNLWIGGAGEYVTFLRRRQESELQMRGREISARDSDGTPRVIDYTIDVETSQAGLTVMLPETSEGLRLARVTRGNRESQFLGDEVITRESTLLGENVQLVVLNPGFTTLGLRYAR
jgi:hypothetical protein